MPRLRTPALRIHMKALLPFGPEEYPTTWPYLLMPNACPQLSPGSSGIRPRTPLGVQTDGTIDSAVFASPATSPASLIPDAELYSPPKSLANFFSLPRFQMTARVSPEEESPALPATSPKLLSRRGTSPAASSETVYAVVSANACLAESKYALT